jgi:hypothetical protein
MKQKIAIALGFVLVVIATAIFVDSLPYPQPQEAAYNVRELIPIRIEIPAQSNGFGLLLQAGKSLAVSGSEPILADYTNWDETEARDILAKNKTALTVMREAWSRPYLQVDAVTNIDQKFDYLGDWRHLAQLALVEARLLFNSGHEAQGFTQAMDVIRFGQRIQQADGTIIHYYVGSAIKNLGLYYIRQFTDTTTLSPTNLVSISEKLTNFEASQEALRESLKIEYETDSKKFDDFASMAATNSTFYFQWVYSADKSKMELADQTFCMMSALTNCYAAGIASIPVAKTNESFVSFVAKFVHGNMVGTILNEMTLETRSGMLARKCRENVSVRATRAVLALRAFQIVTHKPASSLQELTPDFLEAVPLDDFDGRPMRYSPGKKEVYSVGVDLIDSGGVKGTNLTTGDITFPFNF